MSQPSNYQVSGFLPKAIVCKWVAREDADPFKAVWSRRDQGFHSFDLNLGDVTYQGGHFVSGAKFTISARYSARLVRLNVKVTQWDADYGRAMGGRETARNFAFEVKAPTRTLTPSALLSLANRLMGTL